MNDDEFTKIYARSINDEELRKFLESVYAEFRNMEAKINKLEKEVFDKSFYLEHLEKRVAEVPQNPQNPQKTITITGSFEVLDYED